MPFDRLPAQWFKRMINFSSDGSFLLEGALHRGYFFFKQPKRVCQVFCLALI